MAQKNKGLIVILDGLGDLAIASLGGLTPLEAAVTPNLDRLAAAGVCGMTDPLIPGVPVATHTGVGVLMGLSPRDALRLSRGPVEAAGIGLSIQPGDVALRCNFATLEPEGDGFSILDRRAGRIQESMDKLAMAVNNIPLGHGITATVRPATQHRAVLRLAGPGLSSAVSDTDPGAGVMPGRLLTSYPSKSEDSSGVKTTEVLNRFVREAYERLNGHPVNLERIGRGLPPANGLITRGAGTIRNLRNIIHHIGLNAAVVAGERTVLGLAQLFNYTALSDERFTSLFDTDVEAKVETALEAMEQHDLVFIHIKAPDICSHDFNPEGKKEFLERADSALAPLLSGEYVVGVTGDHSTDSNTGRHCGDPVPTLFYSPNGRRDGCNRFGESTCMGGGLGRISSTAFLAGLLDAMGYMHNYRTSDRTVFASD
ncbi:MAG: 2,3-bisphosphoglycerate-independent phosphoglycerate mutase [Gammaproteobacteria bacterium]|nr:2,3-bisphosphoglycerate-independent phosphoglycerate mutase [Gammaproteobacteria bacterium]